ncbi:MAG: bifunctional serine/threonine-protein kinase/formylglycine-generating enzyme family protein [Planctomycetaceae bacterium]
MSISGADNFEPTRSGPVNGPGGGNPPVPNNSPAPQPLPFPTNLPGFTVLSFVGGGGFATVFRAHDNKMRRDVAVKRLLPARAADRYWRARFDYEGVIQGDPQMPSGVVQVYQRGDDQYGPYLVMEWVDGGTLADWHQRHNGRAPWKKCVQLCQELAETMEKVHRLRYLHRDLKPLNVLLSAGDRTRISDFGLAKQLGTNAAADPRTQPGMAAGTPGFTAPEQFRDFGHAGPEADQWSIGAILHMLLTNELPVAGYSSVACSDGVMQQRGIPEPVRKAVLRSLSFHPEDRFSSMADFAKALGSGTGYGRKATVVAAAMLALATAAGVVSVWSPEVSTQPGPADAVRPGPDSPESGIVPMRDLVAVPPATFVMGLDGVNGTSPQHTVRISRGLLVSRYEITQQQWLRVMGTRPWLAAGGEDDGRLPAAGIAWRDAMDFCERLTQVENSGRKYRLPTEAEWEYFSRGGSKAGWSCEEAELPQFAWFGGASGGSSAAGPQPVGTKLANPFGLYDVHGNVFEWCLDWFDPSYYVRSPETDPPGPVEPPQSEVEGFRPERVCRGGSWQRNDITCGSGFRFSAGDEESRSGLEFGFRVVVEDSGDSSSP